MLIRRLLHQKRFWSLLLAVSLFGLLQHIAAVLLPGVWKIRVVGYFDRPDQVRIYWHPTAAPIAFNQRNTKISPIFEARDRFKAEFVLNNIPVKALQLNMGASSGRSRIYGITVYSKFAPARTLKPADVQRLFRPVSNGTHLHLKRKYLAIRADVEGARLVCTQPLPGRALFIHRFGVTALIAAGVYLLLMRNRSIGRFFKEDVSAPSRIGSRHICALDGLRGLAAMMVIADHTVGLCRGLGTFGVWIFFALSGFLIIRPFVVDPQLAVKPGYLATYAEKRIRRVVPLYYVYITAVFVVTNRLGEAVRHFLFLQGNGHLWAIPQEMLFYLAAPLISATLYFLARGRKFWSILLLLAIMLAANRWLDRSVISLYGSTYVELRFYLGIFISGMMFGYIYFGYLERLPATSSIWPVLSRTGALVAVVLWAGLISFSIWHWVDHKSILPQTHFAAFGVASGMIIVGSVLGQKTWWGRILAWVPLRSVGVVGLGIYLLHPLVINVLKKAAVHFFGFRLYGWGLFTATLLVTYLIAIPCYIYLEKQFMRSPAKPVGR